jgi:uncharacterized protein (TIGR00255 family)
MVMLSMTGFGEAQQQEGELTVRVEVRSVNNRHLKLSCRLPDGYSSLEPQLEGVVRELVRRGALQLNLQIERTSCEEDYRLNEPLLVHYYQQISALSAKLHDVAQIHLADLLQLPGVISEVHSLAVDTQHEWPLIDATLRQALERLNHMRQLEGAALAADLRSNCESIEKELDQIEQLAPEVVKSYESRLRERIGQLLAEHSLPIDQSSVIREVAVFADRADIAEEVVRLRSHLKQFDVVMRTERTAGRKLEFLIQELLRETNTIGSKGNDAQIARHVVQIKTSIERLREMIQNVE